MSEARFETPDDFVVEELPAYQPEGQGHHTFVWIEKRLRTTEEVARGLARAAGVPARDVGYAGRKDRFAVARQYFSVPGLPLPAALDLDLPGVRVLGGAPHPHKLRTGHLAGNRFDLRVRGVSASERARAHAQAGPLVAVGLQNRFGPQRFGRDGDNPERARRLLRGSVAGIDRRDARFLISALQAEVFNEALRRRELPLDRVELGDLARRTDSGGLFLVDDVEAENQRAARFEISATGPIFGTRAPQPGAGVAEREREALLACGVDPDGWRPLRGVRMRGARRPVRVRVLDLDLRDEADALRVRFELPAGSFASVLLEELLGSVPERGLSSPP